MNTKSLLRNIALMCTLLLDISIHAQETKTYNPSGKQFSIKAFSNSNFQIEKGHKIGKTLKATSDTKADECTVTFNLIYDSNYFRAPNRIWLISEEIICFAFDNGEGLFECSIPQGTYDIVADFMHDITQYYTIKEQVEINGDTAVTLNPVECTNHISINNYSPNGELFYHGLGHYDENSNEWITDENGNVSITQVTNCVYLKGVTSLGEWTITFMGDMDSDDMRLIPADIYVTDVSNRFLFTQKRISIADSEEDSQPDKYYISYYSTDNLNEGNLETNLSNYIHFNDNYKYTPQGKTTQGIGDITIIYTIYNNLYSGYSYLYKTKDNIPKQNKDYTSDIWINAPYIDPYDNNLNIIIQTGIADYEGIVTNQWTGEESIEITGWIIGPSFIINNGQRLFANIGYHSKGEWGIDINPLYNVSSNIGIFPQLTPTPQALTYNSDQAIGMLNDNCPINALRVENVELWGQMSLSLTPYLVGRYGEMRWGNEGTTTTTKFNGTEVDMESFSPEEKGVYEITITNTNTEVDGLPGHNTTTVYFDQNQEDMTPPSIEMLQFKNCNGEITDRFNTASDGTIEFYASDLDYHFYLERWAGLYEVKPVEVQVEYAPYNTEEWQELPVVEIPELFQEPGWGYFYRGSLANVTGLAEKGWFDLKFRFEDAAGNWQEQVVSPAFRIDDLALTGINEITLMPQNEDNTIYNLAGQRLNLDLNSLPHGIYIVGGKKIVN